MIKGAYFSVTPATVRFDKDLPGDAKLLYGEISALWNTEGYCWAKNSYFAEIFNVSERTVSRWVKLLEGKGYIRTEQVPTAKGSERRIFAGFVPPQSAEVDENVHEGVDKNVEGEVDKNVEGEVDKNVYPHVDKNVYHNNKGKNINKRRVNNAADKTPELTSEVKALLRGYVGDDKQLARQLADMIENREALGAMNTLRGVKNLLRQLDRYSGGDRDTKLILLERACTNEWKSVYPLRDYEKPRSTSGDWAADEEVIR